MEILSLCYEQDDAAILLFRERQYNVKVAKFVGNPSINTISGWNVKNAFELDCAMVFLLFDLMLAFSGPYKPTDSQVFDIAEAIKSQYYFLTVEEIIYIFANAKSGKYGRPSMSGIDQVQIMEWLKRYDSEERTGIAVKRQTAMLRETDHLTEYVAKKLTPKDDSEALANVQQRIAIRDLKEKQYWAGDKKAFDDLALKAWYSLIPFEVLKKHNPHIEVGCYLRIPNATLQELYLAEVLQEKALACGVTFAEYKAVFPKKKHRDYLNEQDTTEWVGSEFVTITLADRIGKKQQQEFSAIVKTLTILGISDEIKLETLAKELHILLKTDYEAYQKRYMEIFINHHEKK